MNSQSLYLKTKPLKLFFTAAIPGAISMLAATLYGLFDGIFVGQILGETAFAAISLAFPFVIINFSLSDLVGVGSAVPISICLGKKQEKEANNYFSCACLMIVLTGILMGIILYFTSPALMRLMGADGELAELAVQYIRVYAICSPVTTIVFAADNFLRICGRIKTSMFLNVFMSILTIVLEFLCLSVFKMGIWGAAFAICSAMIICAVIALYFFVRGKLQLRFCKPTFSVHLIKQIVSSGSPNFLSNVSGRLTSIVMNMALLHLGGQGAVTVYGIMMYAGDIMQPLLYGVYDSLQPAIGYNYGAGQIKRVKSIEKCCMVTGAIISGVAVIAMLGIPEMIASLFLQPEKRDLLPLATRAIRMFSLAFITRWFGFAIQSFFVALGKPLPAVVMSVANAFVFPLLLIAALWPLKLDGLWLNGPVTSALVAILAGIILIRMRGKLFVANSTAENYETEKAS